MKSLPLLSLRRYPARAVAVIICLYALQLGAQPQQSENFRITKSVIDAGGGVSTSTNFRLVSAFGQPTPVGVSSSVNFTLSAGFLTPVFGVSPLSPIADLVVQRQPGMSLNMQLDWTAMPGATGYTIYRDTDPQFTPGETNQVGTSSTNSFVDTGAVSLPALRYFYIVTSSGAAGPGVARAGEDDPAKRRAGPGAVAR